MIDRLPAAARSNALGEAGEAAGLSQAICCEVHCWRMAQVEYWQMAPSMFLHVRQMTKYGVLLMYVIMVM